jgi:prefoldin subunit 5
MEHTETTEMNENTDTAMAYAADDLPPTPVAIDEPELVAVGAPHDLPPPAMVVDAALVEQMAALQKRTNLMLGAMGVLLAGALVAIALLFGRVADANENADAAQTELATARADLERVEAGAALYSSQIEGFQEKLVELRPQISAGVEEAITGLRTFGDSTIEFPVNIDQTIPIDTEVVIDRTVQVPIKTTIPINQSFDTTIQVDTPFGKIPLDVTVPVDVDVPIDLTVDIPIKETVPIKDEIPVKLDIPVKIDVSQTELKELTDSIAAGLESLQDMLTGLT